MKRFLLWLLPARRVQLPPPHTGIRLRVSIPAGPVLDVDSDALYHMAVLGGPDDNGWLELFRTAAPAWPVVIEVKAVHLVDWE